MPTQVGKFLREVKDSITTLFSGKLPNNWEEDANLIIDGLNTAKKWEASQGAITIAGLFKGGNFALQFLTKVTNEGLISIEMAKGALEATKDIADPNLKADAVIAYLIANISKLPVEWQNKHYEDIAVQILKALLNISGNEARSIITLQIAKQS